MQPPVRNDGDIWGHRLEHWDSESGVVLLLGVTLSEDEGVMEKNHFSINVFLHHDEEGLSTSMTLFIPSEVGNDREVDAK